MEAKRIDSVTGVGRQNRLLCLDAVWAWRLLACARCQTKHETVDLWEFVTDFKTRGQSMVSETMNLTVVAPKWNSGYIGSKHLY